jgi:hypothetical protein
MIGWNPRNTASPLLLLVVLTTGCKATPPGKWETVVVTGAKHWIFVGGKDAKNPLTATPDHISKGKENFSHYCVEIGRAHV